MQLVSKFKVPGECVMQRKSASRARPGDPMGARGQPGQVAFEMRCGIADADRAHASPAAEVLYFNM